MGLDMYLSRKVYIGAGFEHRKVRVDIKVMLGDREVKIDPKKISAIIEDAGYWRKANAIHKWFVDHAQNGKDDCGSYSVSYEQLLELRTLCQKVLETKEAHLLPPQGGFFFGGTEINEDYFKDLQDTIAIIDSLDPEGDYYYQSSW